MKSKIFSVISGVVAAGIVSTIAFAKDHRVLLELEKGKFTAPTEVHNPWMPLKPGMQYIYDGAVVEDGEKIAHRIVFTVTDLTKIINGIETRVIWDRDFSKDKLLESELTFFAQDDDGNVWHLGQHREVYDETEFVGGRTWLIGHLEGAKAGIMMKADPKAGAASYSQGFAPAPFNWTDRARLIKTGTSLKVAYGTYDDVLVIEEFNEEEPGAFQLKYYAKGVGNIGVGWTGDDENKETLELVEVRRLSAEELAKASAEALELEKRAYIYATTPPARRKAAQ